jgi:hypothetical protein
VYIWVSALIIDSEILIMGGSPEIQNHKSCVIFIDNLFISIAFGLEDSQLKINLLYHLIHHNMIKKRMLACLLNMEDAYFRFHFKKINVFHYLINKCCFV